MKLLFAMQTALRNCAKWLLEPVSHVPYADGERETPLSVEVIMSRSMRH
ncbi:MAG: hypothetical protein MUC92_07810 [Fimbriimonadaceae bacterium]|jgi:hypothetical protein|nr:hypothetical protein [Fimbriimonadaceae bacterium]